MHYSHITARQVIDEVVKLAQERPDFIYTRQTPTSPTSCSYVGAHNAYVESGEYTGEGCIVGQALSRLGVSHEDLLALDKMDDGSAVVAVPHLGISGTGNEYEVLRKIQSAQDTSLPWGDAVERGLQTTKV